MIGARLLSRLRAARRDQRGAAALEFALVAPVMLVMFVGLVEVGQVIVAGRRTGHVASALADLVGQNTTMDDIRMTDIFAAGTQMIKPMSSTNLKTKVTQVSLRSDGTIKVDWSKAQGLTAETKNAIYPLPANLVVNTGEAAIIGTAQYTLVQISHQVILNDINYTRVAYVKPRNGAVTYLP